MFKSSQISEKFTIDIEHGPISESHNRNSAVFGCVEKTERRTERCPGVPHIASFENLIENAHDLSPYRLLIIGETCFVHVVDVYALLAVKLCFVLECIVRRRVKPGHCMQKLFRSICSCL